MEKSSGTSCWSGVTDRLKHHGTEWHWGKSLGCLMSEINENNFGSVGKRKCWSSQWKRIPSGKRSVGGKSHPLNGHQSFIYTPEVESPNSWWPADLSFGPAIRLTHHSCTGETFKSDDHIALIGHWQSSCIFAFSITCAARLTWGQTWHF